MGNGVIHAVLRKGSVHTASGSQRFIRHVATQARELAVAIDFRINAGYRRRGTFEDRLGEFNQAIGAKPTSIPLPINIPLAASAVPLTFWAVSSLICMKMTGPIKTERRGSEILRAISFASAVLLFLHAAAFPIYWGFGSLFIFGLPDEMKTLATILTSTTTITLAVFCISTQYYLASKRTKD